MSNLSNIHYALHIEPHLDRFTFDGQLQLTATPDGAMAELMLNAIELEILHCTATQGQKSIQAMGKGDLAASAKFVEEGFAVINSVRSNLDQANEKARRAALAFLTGMRGELHLARGAHGPAAKCFLDAAQLDPDAPMVTRWRALAARLKPRLFR